MLYLRLAKDLNYNPGDVEYLKEAEIEAELENVIGIQENLDRVEDGDILVSDMYLPEDIIRKILQKAGLKKQVDFFIKAKGKRTGCVWGQIIEQNIKIARHLGDNPHTDVYMAEKYGIRPILSRSSSYSPIESSLDSIGAKNLAKLIRKIRLTNYFKEPLKRKFYDDFVQSNIVMLLTFSVFLCQISKQIKVKQFLFSSRDCYYLHKIFRQFAKNSELNVYGEYFFTSRLARVKCSEDYRSYVLDLVSQERNSAIVDLTGTGLSLSYLFEKIDKNFSLPIVLFHHQKLDRFEKMYQDTKTDNKILSLIPPDIYNLDTDNLEILNSISQPMVKDVLQKDTGEYAPIFDSEQNPAEIS